MKIATRSVREVISARALFVAQGVYVDYSGLGGERTVQALCQSGHIQIAGLANEIPYGDHRAMFEDGVRAANQALSLRP